MGFSFTYCTDISSCIGATQDTGTVDSQRNMFYMRIYRFSIEFKLHNIFNKHNQIYRSMKEAGSAMLLSGVDNKH